ncbi:MAG: 23S rRNA (pseudouridine(1915)-N(3))-methyltransferase RlmH [Rickettsiaceae bacterium]|jgi:23S rRNA (pseudouridine1915-N3)-methyltransferase|nr:23S rRNA (pseudouridine(1915)-N(3))-methyltransferase RlmH [Rickettsiaceae bacterium]
MKIQIISVGKLSGELAFIADKYKKMISWQIKDTELPHSKKSSSTEIKEDEARQIKGKITDGSYIIVLDLSGKQISSEGFSALFAKQMMLGKSIDFIIGGAFGLDESIVKTAHTKLCLSEMTFPHQLVKVMLLEQIYRAQTILDNHPYHK